MKFIKLASSFITFSLGISAFAGESIKVGITSGPSQQVLEVAKKLAKEKYDLDIKVISFADYQIPNEALNAGDIDANIFQTVAFYEQAKEKKGYKIEIIGNTFIYPMGLYSRKIKKISDLSENSTIVIPNDPSNQSRALILLQNAGLITLKDKTKKIVTPHDIASNPKKINIKPVDAAQAARTAQDVTAVVLNNDFVLNAGFKPKEALFRENPETAKPYINVIVIRSVDTKKQVFQHLKSVMNSEEVRKKTEELFPGAVAAW